MKNKFIGLREFQRKLTENLPAKEERLILTRHGKPVAMVSYLSTDDFNLSVAPETKTTEKETIIDD